MEWTQQKVLLKHLNRDQDTRHKSPKTAID